MQRGSPNQTILAETIPEESSLFVKDFFVYVYVHDTHEWTIKNVQTFFFL